MAPQVQQAQPGIPALLELPERQGPEGLLAQLVVRLVPRGLAQLARQVLLEIRGLPGLLLQVLLGLPEIWVLLAQLVDQLALRVRLELLARRVRLVLRARQVAQRGPRDCRGQLALKGQLVRQALMEQLVRQALQGGRAAQARRVLLILLLAQRCCLFRHLRH